MNANYVKKIKKCFLIALCCILIADALVFAIYQTYHTQNGENISESSHTAYTKNYKDMMREIYNENSKYFDLVATGFSDIKSEGSSEYYIDSSELVVDEYQNYKEYKYSSSSDSEYFDFSQEEIEAFYYVLNELGFSCIEFSSYDDGEYNLFFKKNTRFFKEESKTDAFVYGLSFSSDNNPHREYYSRDVFSESKEWGFAFFGYV